MPFEDNTKMAISMDCLGGAPPRLDLLSVGHEVSSEEGSCHIGNAPATIDDANMDGTQTGRGMEGFNGDETLDHGSRSADLVFGCFGGTPTKVECSDLVSEEAEASVAVMASEGEDTPGYLPWSRLGIQGPHGHAPERAFSGNLMGDGVDGSYSFAPPPVEKYTGLPW